jgi:hypothetical protein
VIVALAMAAALTSSAAEPCRVVHGRMDLWNGAPTVRIWVTGTHRVLGVEQPRQSLADLPASVRAIWNGQDAGADWATAIWGDFKVCAVERVRRAHLQRVRLVDAWRLAARARN